MNTGLSITSLFMEGLLSFFSPCVLPLVPLYIGYLTQDAKSVDERGNIVYRRGRTFVLTMAFVLGICTVFVIAGLGSGLLHRFFTANTLMFQIIGGILLVLFGLVSLHVIRIPLLEQTHQFNVNVQGGMGFVKAWLMGFFFSFAWTPCIGPMMAQAIVMAASATNGMGWVYIASFAAGFILIFLLLGLFTGEVLNALKKHRDVVRYTGIIGGVIVLGMGCWTLVQAYNTASALQKRTEQPVQQETAEEETEASQEAEEHEILTIEDLNFTLKDGQGAEHSVVDYKGKTVIVNFFGTWCYYCKQELPGLQALADSREDVQVLLVAAPGVNGEGTIEDVEKWMQDNGYSMPVLYDETIEVTQMFGISGYPTSFFICPDGTFLGYVPGYVDDDTLGRIVADAASHQ